MKQDDIAILKDIQRNTHMAMTTLDTLLDKVEDKELTMNLARQSIGYARIHNDAIEKLIEAKSGTYRNNQLNDILIRGNVHANTLLNTSTSHLADMMIQNSYKGMTDIYKSVKHHTQAGDKSVELAQELMDFEQKNIDILKEYL
ncbi:MAG: hypothetical protein IJO97_00930 [Lachnospiraceae bacterium]|nr:hypothetical protein [Lachnospiraceae bacterium]